VRTGEETATFPARMLLRRIAEGAWECGDPGMQYDDAIQSWNPCPNSGRIEASNPCSEYLFLNDTACNLASLNLLRFLREDNSFDSALFRDDVRRLLVAMEAVVDRSSYPTGTIRENSRRFRPLGLGYANLGALLMSLGLPYDSATARGWAAAITALMTGEAYRVSARMAKQRGAFDGFEQNREPFLAVLDRHAGALDEISGAPDGILQAARTCWDEALTLAKKHGVRNAQVTVLAPTGTIAFLMDCDTTGIEPDLALVKYKRLVGGGTLKLTNHSIDRALRSLGYDADAAARIASHVEENETIDGAPGLQEKHRHVFHCAFEISAEGHMNMMAAVQPFLSGGISKTINLPEDATVAEIEDLFLRGWKLGLKALAVFRENSKGVQPLGDKDPHCVIYDAHGCCD
jgi:ribonucleoside-diphosphate reductase alpha chain